MDDDTAPARTRPLLLLAGVAAGLAAAVALGTWAGRAVYGTRPASDPGTWDDIDDALDALAVGFAVGFVVYAMAVVVAVRCTVVPGRRAAGALAILAATVVVPALARSAGSPAGATELSALGATVGGLAGLVAAGALIGAVVGAVPSRTAGRVAAAAIAALVLAAGVG